MHALTRASELGMDLSVLAEPQPSWEDSNGIHFWNQCRNRSWPRQETMELRSILQHEPCARCVASAPYHSDFRKTLQMALRAVALQEILDHINGGALHEQGLRDLKTRVGRLQKSRTEGTWAAQVLAQGQELLDTIHSGSQETRQRAAFSWAISDLLGGNKDHAGVLTSPGAFGELFQNEREAMVLLARVTRRWRRTKRAGEDRSVVLADAIGAVESDHPRIPRLVEEVFDQLDAYYQAELDKPERHIVCVGPPRWTLNPNDPAQTILEAYTVHGGEAGRIVVVPEGVVRWLTDSKHPYSYAGVLQEGDDHDTWETLLGLWDRGGGAALQDARSALEATRLL